MGSIFEEPDAALATAAKLLDAKDLREAAPSSGRLRPA